MNKCFLSLALYASLGTLILPDAPIWKPLPPSKPTSSTGATQTTNTTK